MLSVLAARFTAPASCNRRYSSRRPLPSKGWSCNQPQFRVADAALVGFEALVRWPHPLRGLLMSDSFVPMAAESDLILQPGAWVPREAGLQQLIRARHSSAYFPSTSSRSTEPS